MIKLALRKPKPIYGHGRDIFPWASCAPFVDNSRALLIHRPREVSTYTTQKRSHLGITFWCGNTASGQDKFTFLETPMQNKLLCARCETAAVSAGLPSADELAGQHVHIGKLVAVQTCCGGKNETP